MQAAESHDLPLLDRLLASLEVDVNGFAVCEVQRGWFLALASMDAPLVHYILKGTGILHLDTGTRLPVDQHDFVVLPANCAHRLEIRDDVPTQARGADQCVALVDGMLRIAATADGSADLVSTCGTIEASYAGSRGLFDSLTDPIALHLSAGMSLRHVIETLLSELAAPKLGTHALAGALLKQCLILLIRELQHDPARLRWLVGTMDPRLLRPLLAMIEDPARGFSLEMLAEMAGMSRSNFAAHFSSTFGQSAIDFLKTIRLKRAAKLLQTTNLPVATIARSIGYESRTYFSRAFHEAFGMDPRSFRTRSRT